MFCFHRILLYLCSVMLPPKIEKVLYHKIKLDLSDCKLITTKSGDIWLIDIKTNQWYLQFSKGNVLYYYIDYFSLILRIFSIDEKDYNLILRELAYELIETNKGKNKWKKISKITPLSSKLESLVESVVNEKI